MRGGQRGENLIRPDRDKSQPRPGPFATDEGRVQLARGDLLQPLLGGRVHQFQLCAGREQGELGQQPVQMVTEAFAGAEPDSRRLLGAKTRDRLERA